jgi:hypothetical protein
VAEKKKKKKKYWTLAKWSGLVVGFNLNINVERQKKKKNVGRWMNGVGWFWCNFDVHENI